MSTLGTKYHRADRLTSPSVEASEAGMLRVRMVLRVLFLFLGANGLGSLVANSQPFPQVLSMLVQRWSWEAYWEQGIAKASFTPFSKKPMEWYSAATVLGFCLPHLNYCASYESNGTKLGRLLVSGRCGVISQDRRCVDGFIQENAPRSLNWISQGASIAVEIVDVPGLPALKPELCTRLTHGLERCGAQATWNP
jgi:hypothetical protein